MTAPGEPVAVYSGPLAPMPPQPTGRVEPGQSRSYEFVATLPEAGSAADQNHLQGASTSVAYSWTVAEAPPPADPKPPPADPPPAPRVPSGSPGPTYEPPAADPLRLRVTRPATRSAAVGS